MSPSHTPSAGVSVAAVHEEAPAVRRQGGVDALDVGHDLVVHVDVAEVGDGVAGCVAHGVLLHGGRSAPVQRRKRRRSITCRGHGAGCGARLRWRHVPDRAVRCCVRGAGAGTSPSSTLAHRADVSARHLSFIETGRSRPSPDMVLRLCDHLEVPLREQNRLLLASGHAPAHPEHDLVRPVDGRGERRDRGDPRGVRPVPGAGHRPGLGPGRPRTTRSTGSSTGWTPSCWSRRSTCSG